MTSAGLSFKKGTELAAAGDGIMRSAVFPGLWIDACALLESDLEKVLDVINRGLSSPEHEQFVSELASKRHR